MIEVGTPGDGAVEVEVTPQRLVSGTLPVLPLREAVPYPDTLIPLAVGQERSMTLVNDVLAGDRTLVMVSSRDPAVEEPAPEQLYEVGVVGSVARMLKVPDGTLRILVQGAQRVRIDHWVRAEPYLVAEISELRDEDVEESAELTALVRNVQSAFGSIVEQVPYLPEEMQLAVANLDDPAALSHLVAGALRIKGEDKQALLEERDVRKRLRRLSELLAQELEVVSLGSKIQSQVQSELDRTQREYVLRQQMQAIQQELGEVDSVAGRGERAARPDRGARASRGGPQPSPTASSPASSGCRRPRPSTASSGPISSGSRRCRGARRPRTTSTSPTPARCSTTTTTTSRTSRTASSSTSRCGKLKPDARGPILCFVGPPGVGKTSLGRSIARALGRQLRARSASAACATRRRSAATAAPTSARCRDASSRPLRDAGANNPVVMLDEIDKLGADFRGDPASALLEVLDPEQNHDLPRPLPRPAVRPLEGDLHHHGEHARHDPGRRCSTAWR